MKDRDFIRGNVPMTKEEVRAVALAKLELFRARRFLDVGAGTGSLAVEAKVTFPNLEVVAIERHPEAVALIRANGEKHGAPLEIIEAVAPLDPSHTPALARFDAIFVGGTGGRIGALLEWFEEIANPGSPVVLTFVTLEQFAQTMEALTRRYGKGSFEVTQISVSKGEALGPFSYLKPNNPTFLVGYHIPWEIGEKSHEPQDK